MKFGLVVLSVFLIFSGAQAQLEAITGAIGAVGSVLSMFKRDSSTKFGDLQSQKGFTDLESHTDYATGAVKQSRLGDMFAVWIKNFPMQGEAKTKLAEFMMESEFQEFIEPNQKHVQDFKFSDAKGKLYYLKVQLVQHPTFPDIVKWEKVMWTANFQVAKPFMVVTKTKSNFFGSKTQDSIRYFQATLQPEHMDFVKSLAIPFISLQNDAGQTVVERRQ